MKKRNVLRKILIFTLIFAMLVQYVPLSNITFADSNVGYVVCNGTTRYFSKVKDLWEYATDQGTNQVTIYMLSDWNTGDKNDLNKSMTVPEDARITINMNGYMIDRGLVNKSQALKNNKQGYKSGQVFYVKKNAQLTINGGDKSRVHRGYIDTGVFSTGVFNFDSKSSGYSYSISGGLLTGAACNDKVGGGCITALEGASVTLNDVTIAGNIAVTGYYGGYGGAVRMNAKNSSLTINNSTLEFNYAKEDGGAIYSEGANNKLNISNTTIKNNGTDDCGGGICVYGVATTVRLDNSVIDNNDAVVDGGGVFFCTSSSSSRLYINNNSVIQNNHTDGNGGGIRSNTGDIQITSEDGSGKVTGNLSHTNGGGIAFGPINLFGRETTLISGISIENNTADNYGGGIYSQGFTVNVSNSYIAGNRAKSGGGAYCTSLTSGFINDNELAIFGTTVEKNTASSQAAGIYVDILNANGTVKVIDNKLDDGTVVDTYLRRYIKGNLTTYSRIGITHERYSGYDSDLNNGIKLSDPSEGKSDRFNASAFFSNREGEAVKIDTNKSNTRPVLMLVKGTQAQIEKVDNTDTVVTSQTVNGQPVIKGYFSYPSVVETTVDLDSVFYFSDGYFLSEPSLYNEHLATMSMTMAMSAFYSNIGNDYPESMASEKYLYKSKNIRKLFTDIGIAEDNIYISDTYVEKPGTDTIGYAIGQKELPDGTILVPIAVRGAGYESEWTSNVTVGGSGEHEGFASAADQVFAGVKNYIKNYGLEEAVNSGKVRFWVAGYSRAGATSNLTAKRLIDAYAFNDGTAAQSNRVYAYCFEAPKGGVNTASYNANIEKYNSIHNCINKADIVPLVAPEEMGFIRYGVDHYVPGDAAAGSIKNDTNVWSYVQGALTSNGLSYKTQYDNTAYMTGSSEYISQRQKMKNQLAMVDSTYIAFDDYFNAATINYVKSILGADLIKAVDSKLKVEDFNRIFMRAFQTWGLYSSSMDMSNNDFRKSFLHIASGDIYSFTVQTTTGGKKTNTTISLPNYTMQQSLRVLTKYVFSLDNSDYEAVMGTLDGVMDRLSMSEVYDDLIGDWGSLSVSERNDYLTELWDKIVAYTDKKVEHSILYYLTGSEDSTTAEAKELRASIYCVIDILLNTVAVDYNTDAEDWDKSKVGYWDYNAHENKNKKVNIMEGFSAETKKAVKNTDDCQILIGTLAYNASVIMQAHYPEINYAWLRSYDSYFENETSIVDITENNKAVVQHDTSGAVLKSADDASRTYTYYSDFDLGLYTDETTAGATILYSLSDNGSEFSDWKPYTKSIHIGNGKAASTYTIKTKAVYLGSVSDEVTTTYVINDDSKVYINDTEIEASTSGYLSLNAYDDKSVDKSKQQFVFWRGVRNVTLGAGENYQKLVNETGSILYAYKKAGTTQKYDAVFVNKVSGISISVNADGEDNVLTLTRTDDSKVDTTKYTADNKWNIAYNLGDAVTKTSADGATTTITRDITVEATLYPYTDTTYTDNEKSDVYFVTAPTAEITIDSKDTNPVGTTTVKYNSADGSVYLSRSFKYETTVNNMVNVTVECYDAGSPADKLTADKTYVVFKNKSSVITAPSISGKAFVYFEDADGNKVSSSANNITITTDKNMTLKAYYVPVLDSISIAIPEVKEGEALPASVSGTAASAQKTQDISQNITLVWEKQVNGVWTVVPSGETVQSGTAYRATVNFASYDNSYKISANVSVSVKVGNDDTAGYIVKDAKGNLSGIMAYVTLPVEKYSVTVDGENIGTFEKGQVVSVSAKNRENEQFVNWTGLDSIELTSGTVNDTAITFVMPESDVVLTSNYVWQVTDVEITIDADGIVTDGLKLLTANNSEIQNYSSDKYNISYIIIGDREDIPYEGTPAVTIRTVKAVVTMLSDDSNNVYFSKNIKASMENTASTSEKGVTCNYNAADGSVTVSGQFEYELWDIVSEKVNVNVKAYDSNSLELLPGMDDIVYSVEKDKEATITAPVIANKVVACWKDADGNEITSASGNSIKVNADSDKTLSVYYTPVLDSIDVKLDGITSGNALPSVVNECTVTSGTDNYSINNVNLKWSKQNDNGAWEDVTGNAAAGVTYKLTLNLTDGGKKYELSDNIAVSIEAGDDTSLTGYVQKDSSGDVIVTAYVTLHVTKYDVTVDGKLLGSYEAGEVVRVNADVEDGMQFVGWTAEIEDGTVFSTILENGTMSDKTIAFKMPQSEVSLHTSTVKQITNVTINAEQKSDLSIVRSLELMKGDEKAEGYSDDKWNVTYTVLGTETNTDEGMTTTTTTLRVEAVLHEDKVKGIYFAKDITGTINAATGAQADGDTKVEYNTADGSVILTRTYKYVEKKIETVTVKVHYYDYNNKAEIGTRAYSVQKGRKISISASPMEDETFYGWYKGSNLSSMSEFADTELANDKKTVIITADSDIELVGLYIPVVKRIEFTINEPKAGQKLPLTILGDVQAVITNEYNIPALELEWYKMTADDSSNTVMTLTADSENAEPGWEKITDLDNYLAEYNTVYRAYIKPDFSGLSGLDGVFTISDNVTIVINDQEYSAENILFSNGKPEAIRYTAKTESKIEDISMILSKVIQPDMLVYENTQIPQTPDFVEVMLNNGDKVEAYVEWNSFTYTRSDNDQVFEVDGNVVGIDNPENVSTLVVQKFFVNGIVRAQAEAPVADVESGTYYGEISVGLSCGTEGVSIFYTLDGTDPATSSTAKEYDGTLITLSPSDKTIRLKMYAKSDMSDVLSSEYAMYNYVINNIIMYTVEYELDGGDMNEKFKTITAESGYDLELEEPSRSGYTFVNWTDEAGNEYAAGDMLKVSDNIKLTAHWKSEEETSPEEPTSPETPTNPEEPTTPEEPTNPETPTNPEEPTSPETPTSPENPTHQEETTRQEESASQETTTGREESTSQTAATGQTDTTGQGEVSAQDETTVQETTSSVSAEATSEAQSVSETEPKATIAESDTTEEPESEASDTEESNSEENAEETSASEKQKNSNVFIWVLITLACVVVACGLILLIGRNKKDSKNK